MKAALLVFRGALSAWLARAAPQVATEAPAEPSPSPTTEAETPTPRAGLAQSAQSPVPAQTAPPQPATRPSTSVQGRPVQPSVTPAVVNAPAATTAPAPSPVGTAQTDEAVPSPKPGLPTQPPPEEEPLAARFGSLVAPPKATPHPMAATRPSLSPLIQAGLIAEDTVTEEPLPNPQAETRTAVSRGYGAPAAESARSRVPPPPYAGGPMAGQKPTPPALSLGQPIIDVVRGLLKGASGALARQDLMQIASLPEAQYHELETPEARQQGARLNLDLPFVTPQGVAVAQFEISHDGGGSSGGAVGPAERTYKARFSIDIEPLGPVHAMVTLTGARTRVSLWAERAETIARFRAGEESLAAALREAELTPEVAVHSGAPPSPGGVSPLGHFVDQAS
jgi:hypothetical protein